MAVVLVVASAAGIALRRRQGRFRSTPLAATPAGDAGDSGRPASAGRVLTAADLGAPLGPRATLVQFSTEFCAYCGPARQLLTKVAAEHDGVAFVEIDAAERMDLTRRLHVMSTPTVLVLDAGGAIESRASGKPRAADVLAAVRSVLEFPTKTDDNWACVGQPGDDSGVPGE